jgi:hypothetical protein
LVETGYMLHHKAYIYGMTNAVTQNYSTLPILVAYGVITET